MQNTKPKHKTKPTRIRQGDAGVRANAQQPKLFVGMILILIFAEALALYGLIVGIILSSKAGSSA